MVHISASVAKCFSPIDIKLPFLFQFGLDSASWENYTEHCFCLFIIIIMFFFYVSQVMKWHILLCIAMVTGMSEHLEVTVKDATV